MLLILQLCVSRSVRPESITGGIFTLVNSGIAMQGGSGDQASPPPFEL